MLESAARSQRSAALNSQNETLSFGHVMEASPPRTILKRRAPSSPKRRPQLTLNDACFVVPGRWRAPSSTPTSLPLAAGGSR